MERKPKTPGISLLDLGSSGATEEVLSVGRGSRTLGTLAVFDSGIFRADEGVLSVKRNPRILVSIA
jgi:hypothetical protein